MKIKYNAPTTLTYAFFCTLIVLLDQTIIHGLTRAFFTVPNALAFDLFKPVNYLRLFTHIAGHADWNHLMSNLAYILLLGPMLEETYGSLTMFLMILVTGFVTGVLNACFFPHPLLGASGVVFMMILLASFTNSGKDDVPLTFILIVFLYLGREGLNAFKGDDISQFAHLAGGLCGSLFGFFKPGRSGASRSRSRAKTALPRTLLKTPVQAPFPVHTDSKVTLKKPPVKTSSAKPEGARGTPLKTPQTKGSPVRPSASKSSAPKTVPVKGSPAKKAPSKSSPDGRPR